MNAVVADDLAFREERRKYLGGSDIAAVLGVAPPTWRRNTPLALYLDKTTPPAPDTQGVRYKTRGKRWESVVAEMLVERLEERGHKVEILRSNERYTDPDVDYFRAEIDFEVRLDGESDITNVELKTVHPYKVAEWGEEDTDAAPVWYTAQAMWGLGVTRRRRCIIAPLFGADELRTYSVDAAEDVIAEIRAAGRKFWEEHVLAHVPPPPGGLIDLARLFPKDIGTMVDFHDNLRALDALAELRAASDDLDAANARWNAAEFIVKEAMGEAAIATVGGIKVCTWKSQGQTRIDTAPLKEERPDIAAQFEKRIEFRKFLLTKVKERR